MTQTSLSDEDENEDAVWCEWCGDGPWLGSTDREHFCSQECQDNWFEDWSN